MTAGLHLGECIMVRACRDDHAAQIVEFAVSLPLLLVFVVGIFDFSGAFTLKQKITNAARDAARTAAADPATDLCSRCTAVPLSVTDALHTADSYLVANNISDCGIATVTPTTTSGTLTWKYSATSGCPGTGLVIIINRGYYFPSTATAVAPSTCSGTPPASGETAVVATCVNITYAYRWRFDKVITLLGLSGSVPSSITATAVAVNEN